MEREIFFIGVRKIHSKKKEQDYYMADYIDKNNIPQTDYINLEEFNRIAQKTKGKEYSKIKGLFEVNSYNKVYLTDIKA